MQYVRPVDFGAFPKDEFESQRLADHSTGLDSCVCLCTRVPPGRQSIIGEHVHAVDQLYFILSGHMHARIGERTFEAGPRTLVYIPAGIPHINWNTGPEDEVHFEVLVPSPGPGRPLSHSLDEPRPLAPRDITGIELVRPVDDSGLDKGTFSWITLGDRASGISPLSLALFRSPPGGRSPALHAHRFDQIYYIVAGTMQLQIGFERHEAPTHSVVTLPAGMPHANWNEAAEPLYFLNLRVPEPTKPEAEQAWDIPVAYR